MRLVRYAVVVAAALTLAACGGNKGGNDAGAGAGGGTGGGTTGTGGGAGGGTGNCSPSCFTGQVCDPATNSCVECATGFDCTDPAKPTCDPTTHTCTAGGTGGGAGGGGGGTPPANDDCATALTLNFVNGTATATGDTTLANNSNVLDGGAPSCTSTARTSGHDVLYQYTLTTAKDVDIQVAPTATSNLEPVLYLRKPGQCASTQEADELACDATFDPTTPAHVSLFNQQPGTYSVWVDGTSSTSGPFDLTATISGPTLPPANETCATAIPLTLTNGTGSANLNLGAAANDEVGQCATNSTGGDAVFSVNVPTLSDLTVTVGPSTDGGTADSVVYIREGACNGDELACSDKGFSGDPETAKVLSAQGTYYVFVEAYSANTAGPITVTATLSAATPLTPGETCRLPSAVDLSTATTASLSVDTSTFTNEYTSTNCDYSFFGNSAPDVVYAVTIPANRLLDVYAKPVIGADGGAADPLLYVRTTPCSTGTEVSCSDTNLQGQGELTTVLNTDGGTYYVFVDGFEDTSGKLDLSFRSYAATAAPANDLCHDTDGGLLATPLVLNTAATGTNNGAFDNAYMKCNGGGAEVFFAVTPLATATSLTATVTSTSSGFVPAVAIRPPGQLSWRACEDPSADPNLACTSSDGGTVATAVAPIDGGTYIIVVEGANGTRGSFTVNATAQ